MTTAQELKSLMSPIGQPIVFKPYKVNSATECAFTLMREAAKANYGSIILHLDTTLDQFNMVSSECWDYSAAEVLNYLLESGYTIQLVQQLPYAQLWKVIWDANCGTYLEYGYVISDVPSNL